MFLSIQLSLRTARKKKISKEKLDCDYLSLFLFGKGGANTYTQTARKKRHKNKPFLSICSP